MNKNKKTKEKSWYPSILAAFILIYVGAAINANGVERKNYYSKIENTTIENFKEQGEGYRRFADLYKKCNGEFNESVDKPCVNTALNSVNSDILRSRIANDFYDIKIRAYGGKGEAWGIMFSPTKIIGHLLG